MNKLVKFQCNVTPQVKAKIESLTRKDKKTSEVLAELLNIAESDLVFKNINKEDLETVCSIKNFSIKQLQIEALNDYIKKVKNADKKGFKGHKLSVQADSHIFEIVESIIDSNNKATSIDNLIYINQNSLLNWLRKHDMPLINYAVIKRYLRVNADYLSEHHNKLGIKESHNRDLYMKSRLNNMKAIV